MMLVTFLTALVIAGAVGGTGVFIVPLQQEFGWSTAEISSAISIRLILLEGGLHDRCHLRSLARRGPPGRLSCHRRRAAGRPHPHRWLYFRRTLREPDRAGEALV